MTFLPDSIETDRLILRVPLIEDAEKIFNGYAQDSDVCAYLLWKPHRSFDDTTDFLTRCFFMIREQMAFPYSLVLKESGEMVGMAEARRDGSRVDLGYVLSRKYWNRGIMTEVVRSLVAYSLQDESIFRVGATCHVNNVASARVLEKAGMSREGILRRWMVFPNQGSEPADCYSYAAVK